MPTVRSVPLRSARERVVQTLSYEIGAVLLAAPVYQWVFGVSAGESFQLLVTLSVAVIFWLPLHCTVFDWLDSRWFGRVASDRRGFSRWFHAFTYELSTLIVTVPLIVWLGGYTWLEALWLDLGLTLFYTAYAWVFHWGFDRLRPIRAPGKPRHAARAVAGPAAGAGDARHLQALRRGGWPAEPQGPGRPEGLCDDYRAPHQLPHLSRPPLRERRRLHLPERPGHPASE